MFETVKRWAKALKRDVAALWLAARDRRTPRFAKIVAAYALSPIDLIPDFIPILGYVDDLLIVPLGIAIAIRLIPPPLMIEFRQEAAAGAPRPLNLIAPCLIIGIWLTAAAAVACWLLPHIG